MVDIETLDVTPTSVILTIGAQGFCPFTDQLTDVVYYERITLESQDDRSVDDGTIAWWGKQDAIVMEEAIGDTGQTRIPLKTALEKLSKIFWKTNTIWANGITFDMVILENAFKSADMPIPWKYWNVSDARTIYKIKPVGKLANSHNALEDCVNQIQLLQKTLKELNITEF